MYRALNYLKHYESPRHARKSWLLALFTGVAYLLIAAFNTPNTAWPEIVLFHAIVILLLGLAVGCLLPCNAFETRLFLHRQLLLTLLLGIGATFPFVVILLWWMFAAPIVLLWLVVAVVLQVVCMWLGLFLGNKVRYLLGLLMQR